MSLEKNLELNPRLLIILTESVTATLVAKPRLAAEPLVAKPSSDCTFRGGAGFKHRSRVSGAK